MKKTILLIASALTLALGASAQSATATLDVGNYRAPIRSDGQLFQDQSYLLPGLEWPKAATPSASRHIAYTGQIWMAGRDSLGTLRVAANEYGQLGRGYYPGRAGFDHVQMDQVWKINKPEIDQFRADYANGFLNLANYPTIANWPAFVQDLQGNPKPYAPFVDVDGNPQNYDPNAGDYPDIPGDQAIFFGFTDDPGSNQPAFPNYLGFDVIGFAYGYACPQLEDVLFLQYDVQNWSDRNISDLRIGLWKDIDLGNYVDDIVGSDTTSANPMLYCYNGDSIDEGAAGYGANPPAIGYSLLSEPAVTGMYYQNDFTGMGNPSLPEHYEGYLNATWIDSTHLTYGADGHGTSGTATNFAFTGDPGYCGTPASGWSAVYGPSGPFDARLLLATDASELPRTDTKRLTFAVLMARDMQNGNLGSVCKLMTLQDSLSAWMASGHMPCAGLTTGSTAPKPGMQVSLAPNPTHGSSILRFENADQAQATLQILDLQGRQVATPMTHTGSEFTIQTEGLAQGLYLLELRVGGQQTVLRLQKD